MQILPCDDTDTENKEKKSCSVNVQTELSHKVVYLFISFLIHLFFRKRKLVVGAYNIQSIL